MHFRFKARDVVSLQEAQSLLKLYGSPLYVYKEAIIVEKAKKLLASAKEFKVCYALKANTNTSLVKLIKNQGITHVDVVSPGQIYKALHCGFEPKSIMYTQNFISPEELDYALEVGVILNIGAVETLDYYKQKLRGKSIFLRVNPKIGAGSSYHVITGGPKSKFGIYETDLLKAAQIAKAYDIHIIGLHQHIGSNMKKQDEQVIIKTMRYSFSIMEIFHQVTQINIGGGLGVAYKDSEEISDPNYLFDKVREIRDEYAQKYQRAIEISIEPGRYLIADCSALLCRITATKQTPQKRFIGTDTGFNHLIRPTLYGSHHQIVNLSNSHAVEHVSTVCGNICQCTDFLGVDLNLGGKIGDILAIQNTGAYGFSMSSNYNERVKPAEVLINNQGQFVLIRRRETFEDLIEKL